MRKTAIVILAAAVAIPAMAAAPKAPRLGFRKGDSWKVQETMKMGGVVALSVASVSIVKVFPDGSALASATPISCRKGSSATDLKDSELPNGGKPDYRLFTRDGREYLVQGKPKADSPEEQAMMEQQGFIDEIELLKKSQTTEKFLKVMRNQSPINVVHLPAAALAVGAKAKSADGWTIVRQPDEKVDGATCEVYRAELDVMVETDWLDAKAGRLRKSTLVQGGQMPMEATRIIVR